MLLTDLHAASRITERAPGHSQLISMDGHPLTSWIERRHGRERGRIVRRIVAVLRDSDAVLLRDLARLAGEIPETVVARVIRGLALRGLARNVSQGCWRATAALRCEPALTPCAAVI